ncbi:MAG: 50S ribosomal protein L30 [Lachnospiraceae bacterium]|nr:50S ribosomal protein L30 [Lachnospiraceae bacterium]
MAEKMLKITLVKSPIGAVPKQRATVESMGFKKVNQCKMFPDNAATRGQIQQVRHLFKVEEA